MLCNVKTQTGHHGMTSSEYLWLYYPSFDRTWTFTIPASGNP